MLISAKENFTRGVGMEDHFEEEVGGAGNKEVHAELKVVEEIRMVLVLTCAAGRGGPR